MKKTSRSVKETNLKSDSANLNFDDKFATSPTGRNEEMTRRKFLVLSTLAAGGGIAAIFLANSLQPLLLASKASRLIGMPRFQSALTGLITPVEESLFSTLDPTTIPQFENQLTAPPPVYQPTIVTIAGKVTRHDYTVAMTSFKQQLLPPSMNLLTPVWGYSGIAQDALTDSSLDLIQSSPGPTFEAVQGIPIKVTWQNNIATPYMLPVDPTIHWSDPNNTIMPVAPFPVYPPGYPNAQAPVPLVTHLHGGQNQSTSDGGPTQWFTQDGKHGSTYYTYEKTNSNAAVYFYPNTQQPTTLWYHDHALGVTRLNVASGLAGFYLLRASNDGSDKVAPLLPMGKYEMPLVIQDRTFNVDGSLYYPTVGNEPAAHPFWVNMFLGATVMVNGKVWPNMNVDRGQYRFRLLNGSNTRIYNLAFSNQMSFIMIGSDGGYLQAPATLTSLGLAPAERADIIVNFSSLAAGENVVLQNTIGETQELRQIIQFTANNAQGTSPFDVHSIPIPFNPTLRGSTFPTLPKATKRRVLTLYEIAGANGSVSEALLDGQIWAAAISETPDLGATEEWVIVNPTMDAHPIHLHLVQFQLVNRQTLNASTAYQEDWIGLNGQPPFNHPTNNVPSLQPYVYTTLTGPMPQEQAWKDTIVVNPTEVTTIRVRFAPQDGSTFPFDATSGPGYVWHCHLLEHEDNEMMRPYKVTNPPQSLILPATAAAIGGTAVALSLAYYYQQKKKRRPQNKASLDQHVSLDGQTEMLQNPE